MAHNYFKPTSINRLIRAAVMQYLINESICQQIFNHSIYEATFYQPVNQSIYLQTVNQLKHTLIDILPTNKLKHMLIDLQPIKAYVKPPSINQLVNQSPIYLSIKAIFNQSVNQSKHMLSNLQPISLSMRQAIDIISHPFYQNLLINQSLCLFLKKQFSKIPGTSYETKFK